MHEEHPIAVEGIVKRYGDFTAVDHISFIVPKGTIFGLLGPNGAGKTTTLRMIMNIIAPDEGTISVYGKPSAEAAARSIGYLPEERGLYRKMKVLDHLVFLGEIRGLKAPVAKERSESWLKRLDLDSWKLKKVEELSKGMQQKIQFIGCVIHEPEILILDEPFSGLDPVNARTLKDLLMEFRDQGRTAILSTHVMEQAEKLCDHIALLNRSRVVLDGPMSEIKRQHSGNKFLLRGNGDPARLEAIEGVERITSRDGNIEVDLAATMPRSTFLRLATAQFQVESAVAHEASLDEIFVKVVGGDAAQTGGSDVSSGLSDS